MVMPHTEWSNISQRTHFNEGETVKWNPDLLRWGLTETVKNRSLEDRFHVTEVLPSGSLTTHLQYVSVRMNGSDKRYNGLYFVPAEAQIGDLVECQLSLF